MDAYFNIIRQKLTCWRGDRPFLIAIDGVDCAGKTTFAKKLSDFLQLSGYHVILACVDCFHNPREIRYRNGSTPESYYHDSFDYNALKHVLLDPLRLAGSRYYKTAVFDHLTDREVYQEWQTAPDDAILVFEGVFLHRQELCEYWDYSIFLEVPQETAIQRARERDCHLYGSPEEVERQYREKYIPGQQIYIKSAHPKYHANLVIEID